MWLGICLLNRGTIEECYNSGYISGSNNIYSAIVHDNKTNGVIKNCYNIGDVIAGGNRQTAGIVWTNNGKIENCYNISNITTSGLVHNNNGTITNSYYLDSSAPKLYNANNGTIGDECKSMTIDEMQSKDFIDLLNVNDEIFIIDKNKNDGYPIFKWQ